MKTTTFPFTENDARRSRAASPIAEPMLVAIMGFVLVAYLVIGLAMPVLPLYVHHELGRSNAIVGLIAGSPFAAAFLSRVFAGRLTDSRGAKRSIVVGLLCAVGGGTCFVLSLRLVGEPNAIVALLILGRALLGVADSFIITGALSWGLAVMGAQNTGLVMAWVGTSIYAAFAIGAPVGTTLYASGGFTAIAVATALIPLGALAILAPLRAPATSRRTEPAAFSLVVRAIWQPGIGVALAGVGFGAITAFIALLFAGHGWTPVWPAFSAMSVAFIVGRLCFGGLPDRFGGAKVALVCVVVEAVGLLLIGGALAQPIALAGVALSGLGYSLVYPGLGAEAVRRAPPQSRGLAMGAYTAFLDLSLGLSAPLLGVLATAAGLGWIYFASAVMALAALGVVVRLMPR
jgi:MFS family permease